MIDGIQFLNLWFYNCNEKRKKRRWELKFLKFASQHRADTVHVPNATESSSPVHKAETHTPFLKCRL